MPELPEVETIRRQLSREVTGKKIIEVRVLYPKAVRPMKPSVFVDAVKGSIIKDTERRAKLILFKLSNGNTIVTHLRLTGHLFLDRDVEPFKPAVEIIFDLSGPSRLVYDDVRRFGFMRIMPTRDLREYLDSQFGPEPLDPSFTDVKFKSMLATRARQKIKPLLMDQMFLAGVGNIYAGEICFCAKILPMRVADSLIESEIKKLYTCIKKVLREALKYGGSSSDNYLDVFGHQGNFVPRLKVYGRAGKSCVRCSAKLKKIILAGRGTVYCTKCQI